MNWVNCCMSSGCNWPGRESMPLLHPWGTGKFCCPDMGLASLRFKVAISRWWSKSFYVTPLRSSLVISKRFLICCVYCVCTFFIHFQDEYSIFPQSHSMDIHGYVLVYSVTSMKRLVLSVLLLVLYIKLSKWSTYQCSFHICLFCFFLMYPETFTFDASFEVVQVLHDKLLDMVGKIQ